MQAASTVTATRTLSSTESGRRFTNPCRRFALSWTPNDKGDVWTFKLRDNVKFHDGQPFTAKDVAATFDRLAGIKRSYDPANMFRLNFNIPPAR